MKVVGPAAILRSSATRETIHERGQFVSEQVDLGTDLANFIDAAIRIFEQYTDRDGAMCLVLQKFVPARTVGFLSNELRLTDKPYRWVVEHHTSATDQSAQYEYPLSAKQAKVFPADESLICMSDAELKSRLRSVAHYFWKQSSQRTLLEWCWDENRLWIVQRDIAIPRPGGIVPAPISVHQFVVPTAFDGTIFRRFEVGSSTPWQKLRNVNEFVIDGIVPPHRLFFSTAAKLKGAIDANRNELVREVHSLTGGRCVVRTDAIEFAFNRKRTNTVSPGDAVDWISAEISHWCATGKSLQDIVFILHAYIPAFAAAWSYYTLGAKYVRIDGLWGLADGMQFYPCDTYICDPESGHEISATPRFKNLALLEHDDGSWRTERIDDAVARKRALNRTATEDIAIKTRKIADTIGKDVQIMWFVGIPGALGLGQNLPWFKVTPEQRIEERRSKLLHSVTIRNASDIDKLSPLSRGSYKVVLQPEGEDIRDNNFIDLIAARCRERELPIELRGSTLCHAFHQLEEAGVSVFSAEPGKKILDVRQRKAFDKLVRDQIPDVIAKGGEFVRADELEPDDLRLALVGKLIEETEEFLAAKGAGNVTEELSDLLEVLRGLSGSVNVQFSEVERKADEKAAKRGGFAKGIILRSTAIRRQANAEAQLFDTEGSARKRVRLHSIHDSRGAESDAAIQMGTLLLEGSRELSLSMDNKRRAKIRLTIKAGTVYVEFAGFEATGDEQPPLI